MYIVTLYVVNVYIHLLKVDIHTLQVIIAFATIEIHVL